MRPFAIGSALPLTFDDEEAVGFVLAERVLGLADILSGVLLLAGEDLQRDHAVRVAHVVVELAQLFSVLVPLDLPDIRRNEWCRKCRFAVDVDRTTDFCGLNEKVLQSGVSLPATPTLNFLRVVHWPVELSLALLVCSCSMRT